MMRGVAAVADPAADHVGRGCRRAAASGGSWAQLFPGMLLGGGIGALSRGSGWWPEPRGGRPQAWTMRCPPRRGGVVVGVFERRTFASSETPGLCPGLDIVLETK